LAVLAATIVLFVSDRIRVDLVALLVLLAVAWLGLVTPEEAVAGFSRGAVLSIIGVMILAYGLERSGVTGRLARPLLALAGRSERRLLGIVMVAVGSVSASCRTSAPLRSSSPCCCAPRASAGSRRPACSCGRLRHHPWRHLTWSPPVP
jgi:di/tricarboxylate transporter